MSSPVYPTPVKVFAVANCVLAFSLSPIFMPAAWAFALLGSGVAAWYRIRMVSRTPSRTPTQG